MKASVHFCADFDCKNITYYLQHSKQPQPPAETKAFGILIQIKLCLVSKIGSPETMKDHLLNDVAILFEELKVRFQKDSVDTLGDSF